ncbi:MAG TPA: gephyrin-like molybdotransferase Glp [Candidatus Udaeobacter sp.]|nr:gephyrin-like molybdotransferase Glp [Candidatus Udaeobacter sp.]
MISEEEARRRVLQSVGSLSERIVPLFKALDRFSTREVIARLPLPMFDNSAMDGYAVVASSSRKGERLKVIGEQPAGPDRRLRISPGEAVRIFTGAPIPAGADAVVMQEDTTREGDEIVINVDVDPGEFVRRRGSDLAEGQKILARGERLRPATIALLASQGFADVTIGVEVNAAIVSTGDEIVMPGRKLDQGQIYDSNLILLQALLQRCGASVTSVEHCPDQRELLFETIRRGIKNHVLVITGGVSVGEHDLVQATLRSLGAKIDIWRVAIKPGKPFLFGQVNACAVFGLPGNPVSAFVTCLQFVRPAILKMMGANDLDLPKTPARLTVDLTNEGDRPHYVRGRIENGTFVSIGRQESHALFGLSQSNALLRVAVGESLKAGAIVDVQTWD